MSAFDSIIRFLQEGGPFIYVIAAVLVTGLAITIERYLVLSSSLKANRIAMRNLHPSLKAGDLERVKQQVAQSDAQVSQVLQAGINRMGEVKRREDLEYAMEETVMEHMFRLEKRTPMLATLANIATLLGLLGTIMGLIAAFSAVANADPAEKANLLSSSISVAMNTTAFGLITAIPLIFFHTNLQNKTAEIEDMLEMAGIKLLNGLSYKKQNSDA
ncbi:MotA/TolQ/ExbB proton channel family protein [Catenovulum sp. SX2]|uniref:MotA/TolQ/ExbB proton channel family protein n=1 Tax=Catenovulum sp. SX2 TaxID=3398614 RepID=UPI003F844B93